MIELFKHIIHLDLDWIFKNYNTSIYVILFLIIFIETGLVAMPFLPGDSLLFTAGLFARNGHLNIGLLMALLITAAIIGDNLNYWLGRKLGLKVFEIKIKNRYLVNKTYLQKTELFFQQHGNKAIIMARFVPFVRTFAPFAAGMGKMHYQRYFSFDVLGGFLWVGSLSLAGYLLGEIVWIRQHIDLVCLGIIFVSVLPVLLKLLKKTSLKP